MSLREELQKIEPVFKNDDGYDYRIVDDLTDSTLDEYINKVREYYGYKDSDITMLGSAHEADIRADERNKILDAVCETNRRSAKELGLDEIEIHYLIEDVNKLRQEK
jgi:hypothetical protein